MGGRKEAVAAVGEVARTHQYTLLQDAWHLNDANFDFAWSEDVVNELAGQGVKHYCIEAGEAIQIVVDRYNNDEITRSELVGFAKDGYFLQQSPSDRGRTANNLADLIDAANSAGIQVHCVDYQGKYDAIDEAIKVTAPMVGAENLGDLKSSINKLISSQEVPEIAKDFAQKSLTAMEEIGLPDSTSLKDSGLKEKISKGLAHERSTGDRVIAKNIQEATGGEKTAISYGSLHGKQANDLDEFLGNDKVGKVLLTPNSKTYGEYRSWGDNQELAATIIYTDASWKPGHQIQAWQEQARAIGDEIQAKDFGDTKYSQLDMPPPPSAREAQQTQQEVSPQK